MFDAEDVLNKVKESGAKRILIQIPDGLKTRALELSDRMEKEGIQAFVSVESCYGACDLRDHDALLLGCDLVLHIGHSDLNLMSEIPILYYEYFIPFDPVPLLKENLDKLPFRKIGLTTTIQFVNSLPKAKEFLEGNGKDVLISGNGQVLGCDQSNAKAIQTKADCILFIGSGRFHPLGILKNTVKPVLFLDIERNELTDLTPEKERLLSRSVLRVEKARNLGRFGILVSTKKGQFHPEEAMEVKQTLEKKGKKAFLLSADEFSPDKLLGLGLDCLVGMACPRLADDSSLFKKPILTKEEANSL